jgi:hypothetical protein
VPHPYFFLSSLAWNFGLGMTWLAVPLYAYSQGLSNAQIGILFAVPVLAQAPLNLRGGAYSDRIGGRRILLGSSIATVAAGLWFVFAQGFWMLLVGQIVFVLVDQDAGFDQRTNQVPDIRTLAHAPVFENVAGHGSEAGERQVADAFGKLAAGNVAWLGQVLDDVVQR